MPMTKTGEVDAPEVAQRLRRLRESRGLWMEQVALALGLRYEAYRHYERGRSVLRVDQLMRLADYFKMDLRDLVSELFEPGPGAGNTGKQTERGLNNSSTANYIQTDSRAGPQHQRQHVAAAPAFRNFGLARNGA